MINVSQEIYEKLIATPSVVALAGARIWTDRNVPPKSYRPDNGAAVAFSSRGGRTDYLSPVLRVSYKFKFYGETDNTSQSGQLAAFTLYEAVYDALHDSAFGHIRWAGSEILGQQMEEFALNWPYVLAFFEFIVINE